MSVVLERKPTEKDSTDYILHAIRLLASDKNGRVLKDDHIDWLETKLREISRLAGILQARTEREANTAKGTAKKRTPEKPVTPKKAKP